MTGQIPSELANLSNLQSVYLSENQLTGPIPPQLGNLSNLHSLHLYRNQLTGPIPPELGDLADLKDLLLNDNQLTGPIPPELGNLTNLRVLYLGGNRFTGCIPVGLRDIPNNDTDELSLPFCDDEIEQSACATGGAVPDAANNPGLVSDCEALLASRDSLTGTATRNWSADTPIAEWSGVVVDGTPGRVIELHLSSCGSDGADTD